MQIEMRNIQIIVKVTEQERQLIEDKMKHAPDKISGKRVQKVDIVWNFIGMVDFPNEPQGRTAKEKTVFWRNDGLSVGIFMYLEGVDGDLWVKNSWGIFL